MLNKAQVENILCSHNFTDFKWLVPSNDITVAQWVRFRCEFGCNEYGKAGSCPPAVPPIEECRKMICEYENAVLLHFTIKSYTPEEKYNHMSALLKLERDIFLDGFYKCFLLQYSDCVFCKKCVADGDRNKCVNKAKCRPSVDAMGIDIFQTARGVGYEINVLKERTDTQNRFAIILVD